MHAMLCPVVIVNFVLASWTFFRFQNRKLFFLLDNSLRNLTCNGNATFLLVIQKPNESLMKWGEKGFIKTLHGYSYPFSLITSIRFIFRVDRTSIQGLQCKATSDEKWKESYSNSFVFLLDCLVNILYDKQELKNATKKPVFTCSEFPHRSTLKIYQQLILFIMKTCLISTTPITFL